MDIQVSARLYEGLESVARDMDMTVDALAQLWLEEKTLEHEDQSDNLVNTKGKL